MDDIEIGQIIYLEPSIALHKRPAIIVSRSNDHEPHVAEVVFIPDKGREPLQGWVKWNNGWHLTGGNLGRTDTSRLAPYRSTLISETSDYWTPK